MTAACSSHPSAAFRISSTRNSYLSSIADSFGSTILLSSSLGLHFIFLTLKTRLSLPKQLLAGSLSMVSFMERAATVCSLTKLVAVAVRATFCQRFLRSETPICLKALLSRRYFGRKSFPHSETQWASSITSILILGLSPPLVLPEMMLINSGDINVSGDIYISLHSAICSAALSSFSRTNLFFMLSIFFWCAF